MKRIKTTEEWKDILEKSDKSPFLIAKLSATCSLSGFYARELSKLSTDFDDMMYEVVVQESRDVSDMITDDLGVAHETPQVILVEDKEAVFDADHDDIDTEELQDKLKKFQ
ncbi:MAG: bacillithiol system redox-active protein YtxJ [Candidatus Paceibacterota bacterium]